MSDNAYAADDHAARSQDQVPEVGQITGVSRPKVVLADNEDPAPTDTCPSLSKPTSNRSLLYYLLPVSVILISILSLALPIFLGQYILGLVLACLAGLGSVAGLVLMVITKSKAVELHAAGLAISVATVLLGINVLLLRGSIERNDELRTKNEQLATTAKADLDDAKKKFAEAEDAPRKAEEILKKAEEAPKKAEGFFKMAKETQDKTDAAEKRTAELLAKVEELEKKNELDRKNLAEENAKAEVSQKTLKAMQKNLDQTQKDVEAKRQDLVTLKKEIEVDKKRAEEKQKEANDLLKKVEDALKGAALKLKDKNPLVRIDTAKKLGKLPTFPEMREAVSEALVEAMLDTTPEVMNAANEALAKIDPAIQPHVLTLIIGKDKRGAWTALEKLGKASTPALPALFAHYRNPPMGGGDPVPYLIKPEWLDSFTRIAPTDKRVINIVLREVVTTQEPGRPFLRQKAILLLNTVGGDKKDKVKALLTVLDYRDYRELADGVATVAVAIEATEKLGLPEAAEAIPALKKLKLSPDDTVRQAATKALTKIEMSK